MIELSKTYTTRDGREVHIIALAPTPEEIDRPDFDHGFPVSGLIQGTDGWHFTTWTDYGKWVGPGIDSSSDLVPAKTRETKSDVALGPVLTLAFFLAVGSAIGLVVMWASGWLG